MGQTMLNPNILINVTDPVDLSIDPGVVVFDLEIAKSIESHDDWNHPWDFPMSVGCTYSKDDGYRDWVLEDSVPKLVEYLIQAQRVVGFNHIRFDYSVLDGGLMREFSRGDESSARVRKALAGVHDFGISDVKPGLCASLLRGKNVDLHSDITDHLNKLGLPWKGRRTSLNSVARGMLDDAKTSIGFAGGAEAPQAWRHRRALEVILYCRYDVYLTGLLYVMLKDGRILRNVGWPNKADINEFSGVVSLRER